MRTPSGLAEPLRILLLDRSGQMLLEWQEPDPAVKRSGHWTPVGIGQPCSFRLRIAARSRHLAGVAEPMIRGRTIGGIRRQSARSVSETT